MKFSIVVPIYNVEAYLPQCVESILAQTCQNFEVILVDDGSPDGCGGICDMYAAQDSRFRVIHKENGGLSSARNAGLDIAKGEYIYFLDSDDQIAPELLETVLTYMENGADQVIFQCRRKLDDGTTYVDHENIVGTFDLTNPQNVLSYLQNILIPCRVAWSACTSVYSMENIRRYGQRFHDNREIFAEDMQFALCYACHAKKIESIHPCLYDYRVRNSSIMGVQTEKGNLLRIHKLTESVLKFYRRFDDCSLLVEHFDDIYYHLMAGQFQFQLWASGLKPEAYRRLVREEMGLWDEMEQRLRSYLEGKHGILSLSEYELKTSTLFLLGGSEVALRLRCKLIGLLKRRQEKKHG